MNFVDSHYLPDILIFKLTLFFPTLCIIWYLVGHSFAKIDRTNIYNRKK